MINHNKVTLANEQGNSIHERFTGFPGVIQSDHAYIHEGIAFTYLGNTGNLAAAAAISFEFTTPSVASGKYVHWRPVFLSSSANYLTMSLQEGSTTTGGSDISANIRNRNRNSSTPSGFQTLKSGVTVSVVGTEIDILATGVSGGETNKGGGQGGGSNEELVLKPNTKYTLTFTNAGTVTATTGIFKMFWYEETAG